MTVTITRPTPRDAQRLESFFREAIHDAFKRNGFPPEEVTREVDYKMDSLKQDTETLGKERLFFIAKYGGMVVGTVALAKASAFVRQNIPKPYHRWKVIASVFVKPRYQRKGIGRALTSAAVLALMAQRQEGFILDCGYPIAQKYWTHLLGKPDFIKRNCWYGSVDHFFWVKQVEDFAVELT